MGSTNLFEFTFVEENEKDTGNFLVFFFFQQQQGDRNKRNKRGQPMSKSLSLLWAPPPFLFRKETFRNCDNHETKGPFPNIQTHHTN